MEILEPHVVVELLTGKPSHLSHFKNVWKVTVTPVIRCDKPFKTSIIAAANGRNGSISLENLGRFGPETSQDVRSLQCYVFGESGTQTFKIMCDIDRSKSYTKIVEFRA